MTKNKKVIILGGGLSGLSTAYFLKKHRINASIFEKENKPGGLCVSHHNKGFIFDISGHFLHFRKKKNLSLVKSLLDIELVKHKRSAWVYAFGKLIPYPFQNHLHFLPPHIYKECLKEFVKVKHSNNSYPLNNFSDWIVKNFGTGIARNFMIPYNLKCWKLPLDELSYDWADRFIVVPSLEDIISSINGIGKKKLGYHAYFYYPRKGGIEEIIKGLAKKQPQINLNREAVEVNLKEKTVRFKDGKKIDFDVLISTLPLPDLGRLIKGVKADFLRHFKKLRYVSICNVNLGVKYDVHPSRHWIYFPQKNISFFRVGFFHNFSSSLTPAGNSSLYVDVSYSPAEKINSKSLIATIKKDLKKVGVFRKNNKVCVQNVNKVKYAYPVYDRNYRNSRREILSSLFKYNVVGCGRYGGWRYMSMEDVIQEAQEVANSLK